MYMKKSSKTRASLLSSVISLTLCFAMLLGTTFAWFTDTASTGVNKIQAGNLDVDLKYAKVEAGAVLETATWNSVEGKDDLFDKNALWEPGHVEIAYLRVENLGSLALDYSLRVFAAGEQQGVNKAGKNFALSSYLKFGVVPDITTAYTDRADAVAAVTEPQSLNVNDFKLTGEKLLKEETKVVALVVWMPESVGNEANGKEGSDPATIDLKVILEATQAMHENDSFGNNYDESADGMPDHPEFGQPINPVVTVPGVIPATKDDNTGVTTVSSPKTVTAGGITVKYPKDAKIDTDVAGEPTAENNNKVDAKQGLEPIGTASEFSSSITLEADESLSVYELTLPVAQDNNVLVKVTKNIGQDLEITGIYHEGTPLQNETPAAGTTVEGNNGFYTYTPSTGNLAIWVNHSSEVTLKLKGLFDGGTGTEEDPYLISTAEQFANISIASTKTFFKLTNDITVTELRDYSDPWGEPETAALTRLYYKTLDGDGHTITAPKDGYLFGDVRYSTIKNATVELNSEIMTYFAMDSTFDGITTEGHVKMGNNTGAFLAYPYHDFTMKNCINQAELTAGGAWNNYNAVFVGYGGTAQGGTYTFENCVNKGSLVCGTASMFIGNISYGKPHVVINNCRNEGLIQATYSGSNYIFNTVSSVNADGQDSLATYTLNGQNLSYQEVRALPFETFGGSWIHGPADADLALNLNADGTTFTITPSQNAAVTTYKISVGIYGRLTIGGSKLQMIVVDVPDLNNVPLQKLAFVDDTWVANNPTASRTEYEGYTTYTLDGVTYYLYDCSNGECTLDGNPKMATEFAISAYDASGKLIASAGLTK